MRLTPWLSAIRNLGFGARRRQLQKRVTRYGADSLEQLEDRTLLAAVVITPTALDVAEEATTTDTYQVNLDTSPDNGGGPGTGTVQITVTANTDTQVSSDGTNFFGSIVLTFTSTAAQTVTVRAINDSLIEQSTQTVSVGNAITSSNDGAYPLGALTSVSVDVLDNDSANVSIVGGTTTVTEGAAGQNLQVTLNLTANGAAGGTLEVPVTADLPGNADYSTTAASFPATTANGATANIVVLATNDTLIEQATQSFAAQALSITTTATGSATGSEQVDVVDNDSANVSIAAGTTSATEGLAGTNLLVTLNLTANGAAGGTLEVPVTADLPGNADYSTTAASFLATTANGATANIVVLATNDTLIEQTTQSFAGQALSISTTATSSATGSRQIDVVDNDSANVSISAGTTTATEGVAGTNLLVTLNLTANGAAGGTLEVPVTANLPGNADYSTTAASFPATTANGATANIVVLATNDTLIEQATQSFVGEALSISTTATGSATGSRQIDIVDNDSANVSIVGGTTTVTEGAAGQNLQVTLNLTANGAAGGTLEVPVTADLPGNADYSTTAASFPATTANGATANIVVLATNDLLIEGTQSFAGQALSIATTATGSATGSEQVDVIDNDTATVTVVAGQSVAEEGGAQAITVRLNTSAGATLESPLSVTVTAAIGAGASAGDATFGSLGAFNFSAGAGNNTNNSSWTFSPTSDTLVEGSELATLTPSGSTLNGQVSYTANDVTIVDNDTATITFSAATSSVSEGGTSTSFTATLTITANGVSGTGTLDRAVSFDVSDNGPAGTANGAGDDYTFTTQSYTYPIGSVSGNLKTVNLTVHEDIEDEADETVVLQFSNLSDGTGGQVTTGANHTVTILDNDTSAVVFNAPTGNGLDAFRIVLNGANLEIYDNAVLIDSQPVAGITSLTIQGANGENDTFEVDLTGGDIVPSGGLFFNGGTGGTDSLKITGGSQGNVTYNYTNANDGSVVMTAFGTVNYTGLEPIANTGTAANIIFNLPDTADALITLADLVAGTSARLQSGVPTFEVTDFAIPAAGGSITVNMGATTNQTITVTALTLNATTDLTINGQGGTDVVHINGAITNLDALSLTAETIDQTTAVTVAGATTLNAGAAGTITLTQAGNDFQSSVSITNASTASIDDANGITFGAVTTQSDLTVDAGAAVAFNGTTSVGGNLDVQANANAAAGGAISGAGAISVTGTTTLETGTPATATNDITLNNALNDFGSSVTITSANDVDLADANNIILGTSTITNTLTVSATLQILQSGAVSAGATTLTGTNITLTTATNVFGAITVNAGVGAVSIRENDAIVITSVTHSGGSLTLNSGTNAISQTGDIEIGTGDLNLTGGVITLANPNNTFGDIIVNSGAGDVSLRQDGAMSIGSLTRTAGNVILNANGGASDLTQIAPISIATGTIDITAANITLTQANVLGAVTINAGVGNVSLTEADPIVIAALTHTGTLTLDAGANSITQTGVIDVGAGATDLTGGVITLTLANVFGAITVNNGTGAVSITENATMDISAITHNTGLLTLQAGANTINVNGPIVITGGNANFLTTGTLNLNDNVTATVIMGTPTIVNVNNNTAQIQDGVDAALAGATVNVNDNVTFSENVSIPKNLTLLATLDDVIIAGGAGGAALTVTAGVVSATGFYMNTASANSTVVLIAGSLTLRNNAIVESSGSSQAAISVTAGVLNMGVNATSTPGNNSVTLSGTGTLLSTVVPVDASGNYWGSRDLATVEAGISPLALVDFNPYLNLGTNLVGIGFQGDFSDLSAHDDGSQVGVLAITEAYNMLTPVGIIHALTGSFIETVDLGAGVDKAVTFHAGASPGQVVISGDMILTANDTLPIELTAYVAPDAVGPTAESTVSDNFTVTGTVNLGGATLLPIVTYAAQPFERFTIINNLMADAVVGTFGGLPEGSIINVGGVRLRVSYVEFHNPLSLPATPSFFGDGNDVSLTVMTPPVLVELTTSGTLNITGTGWVDDFDLEVSGTNQITLRGNDVTNFQFGNTNTQILGPITVTGDINVSLGNSNDRVLLRGVGAGATFDSGNLNIELGSGNDSVSTTDITAPIVLTTGLTLTGDLSILGGTGDDVINLGGLAATDTFTANAISIDTGTGGVQSVTLDRTTVGTNVSLKNGGAGAQSVALGVNGPNSIGRDLVITQADGAASYAVGLNDTSVGRHLQITNGSGPGAAVVTVNATTAPGRTVGGLTQITNGNNLTNAVTLAGSAASTLQLAGSVTVKNGNATTSNTIIVTDVTDTGTTVSSFTNGTSLANSITFNGTLANTFLGTVAATNGLSTGTNAIIASRLSARGVTFKNGDATTSNTITLGGALATDTFTVAGNTSLTNGASADIVVNVDRLTANVPSGNVTIANGASGAGGTDVIIGAVAAANSITGNLTITNQVSTGTRTNTINNATVSGGGGLSINDFGSGISAINIGTTALVTVARKLDIQDGSSSATTTIDTATVGSMTYNDLGGGTDTINLANAAGTFQNNGVTRLNMGAGSDTVNIAIAGTAIFNDSVFISLGSGNDVLNIGANANSPAFSAANRFQFDGGAGVDQITVSPLSIADYVVGNVPKKLKSKITNFESIL